MRTTLGRFGAPAGSAVPAVSRTTAASNRRIGRRMTSPPALAHRPRSGGPAAVAREYTSARAARREPAGARRAGGLTPRRSCNIAPPFPLEQGKPDRRRAAVPATHLGRRARGKELLVTLSLRNLFRRLSPRGARTPARPPRRATLNVESLEARLVPTFNLTPYVFPTAAGTFHATSENLQTGAFLGTFADARSGLTVKVSGALTPLGPQLDRLTFHGSAHKGLATEQVAFTGRLHEAGWSPLLTGVLRERYLFLTRQVTHTTRVASYGQLLIFGVNGAGAAGGAANLLVSQFAGDGATLIHQGGAALRFNRGLLLNPHIFYIDPVTLKYD